MMDDALFRLPFAVSAGVLVITCWWLSIAPPRRAVGSPGLTCTWRTGWWLLAAAFLFVGYRLQQPSTADPFPSRCVPLLISTVLTGVTLIVLTMVLVVRSRQRRRT
jgi:hypothetical protein